MDSQTRPEHSPIVNVGMEHRMKKMITDANMAENKADSIERKNAVVLSERDSLQKNYKIVGAKRLEKIVGAERSEVGLEWQKKMTPVLQERDRLRQERRLMENKFKDQLQSITAEKDRLRIDYEKKEKQIKKKHEEMTKERDRWRQDSHKLLLRPHAERPNRHCSGTSLLALCKK